MPSKCEVFVLRDEEGPILYAPLRRFAARVNEAAVAAVGRRLNGEALSEEEHKSLEILEQCELFTPAPLPECRVELPTQVTLFPTDGCNLRCRYCYAGAAERRHLMPLEAGKAAIDYAADNAKAQNYEDFVIAFHGNGEPFSAFPLVKELCRYTHEAAERVGVKSRLTAATNGVLNEEQLDWFIAWFDSANISFDGTEALQNRQRPMADGSPSFPVVDRTLRRLNDSGKPFGIRATVTADTVEAMPEIAAFILENYPNCSPLHIEPAWEAGRGLQTGAHTPEAERYVRYYLEAEKVLQGKMPLVFSAARKDHLDLAFCGVCRNAFVLTSECNITACYEACEIGAPGGERFIYGRYDMEQKRFVIDEEKLAALRRLRVDNMPYCENCFCKYHCGGDCAAKLLGTRPPEEHGGSVRCAITRALILHQIQQSLILEEAATNE